MAFRQQAAIFSRDIGIHDNYFPGLAWYGKEGIVIDLSVGQLALILYCHRQS